MTVRFSSLCRALGLQPARVEQWISRKVFEPIHETVAGKAREWTVDDARSLVLFDRLFSKGMPAVEASFHASPFPHGFKNDVALFLAWPHPAHGNGSWETDIVKSSSFDALRFLRSKGILDLVIVSLDDVDALAERAVKKASE